MRDGRLGFARRLWVAIALSMVFATASAFASDPVSRAGDGGGLPPAAAASPTPAWRRVIAQLRIGADDGTAGATDSAARRKAIADARGHLLESLPVNEFRSVRGYDTLPFVALEVSPAGLAALHASPLVTGITDDRLERTQGSGGGGPSGVDPR